MAIVTGLTAERMLAIEAESINDGTVDTDGNLILTRHDGTEIDAGHVKGDKGDNAVAYFQVTDTPTVDLTLTGDGTQPTPWNFKADMKPFKKLMQLAPGYVGPGPAMVTDIGTGLGTQYGPYEWEGEFDPQGNPVVRVETFGNNPPVITGHAIGNSIGGWRCLPLTTDFTTYGMSNAGTRYGPFSDTAMAVRTSMGIVQMMGLYRIKSAKAAGSTVIVTTLPSDMRPDNTMIFHSNFSDTIGEVRVNADGTVVAYMNAAVVLGTWVDLTSITFPAAGVATWTPLTGFLNGFADYGVASFGVASYWVDPYGVCWFNGLVKVGTGNTHICPIPAGLTPIDSQHYTVAGGASVFSAVRMTGSITAGQPVGWLDMLTGPATTSWISLANVTLFTPSAFTTLAPCIFDPVAFISFLGTWSSLGTAGSGNQPTLLVRRPDGLNMGLGLFKGGTIGSAAFGFPERFSTKASLLTQAVSNSARGRIDIIGTAYDIAGSTYTRTISGAQGSNAWISLDGLKWYSGGA